MKGAYPRSRHIWQLLGHSNSHSWFLIFSLGHSLSYTKKKLKRRKIQKFVCSPIFFDPYHTRKRIIFLFFLLFCNLCATAHEKTAIFLCATAREKQRWQIWIVSISPVIFLQQWQLNSFYHVVQEDFWRKVFPVRADRTSGIICFLHGGDETWGNLQQHDEWV